MSNLVRKGECKRCGKCCTMAGLLEDIDTAEMVRQFGQELVDEFLATTCPHRAQSGSVAFCRHYDQRPDFCQAYPAVPGDLVQGCGFYFEEATILPTMRPAEEVPDANL